ncbi:3D domain-containing protein [Eubacterium sp. OM08-24]|uniref:3D domain-containing protein n=1 Tax=Eubacterium sp. OM08-24 TaxID=2292352 RepID=UPI00131415C5|nr:3D domain-containing protein [Eubacterium sp. OM08-24]
MNYSKNMKKRFNKLLLPGLLTVIIGILVIVSCSAIDEPLPETVAEGASVDITEHIKQTTASTAISTEPVIEQVSLGEYKLTAYCGCSKCCGKWGENRTLDESGKPIVYTANQTIAKEGVTIAADISVLPYGTEVIIDGHRYIVQDRGGSITGNKIDIYFESHQAALEFGVQYKEVFIEREVENND